MTQPSAARRTLLAVALAIAGFAAAWVGLHHGFYRRDQLVDTLTYQRYGDAMASGRVPYRDFGLEYPPAALPVFAIPALISRDAGDLAQYQLWFEVEMFACGALALIFMAVALVRVQAGARHIALALGFAAVAPLLIGSLILSRFDLWPAALTVGALAALVSGRHRLSGAVLGVAFAAKIYPAVLLPVALAWTWKRLGRRQAVVAFSVFAATALASIAPFVALSPHGFWDAVTRQTNRPLQIETLGAGVLLVAHAVTWFPITMKTAYGSQNLVGGVADVLPLVQTIVQLMAIVAVWVWFTRGPADTDRLARAWAAAVCAFVAFGKVLSPQYLIWLVPLVPLARGRRGAVATVVLAAALVLTQLWFPYRYWELAFGLRPLESWLVLARDLALVVLLGVLVLPAPATGNGLRFPRGASSRSS